MERGNVPECTRRTQAGWGGGVGFRTPLRQNHGWPEGRRGTASQSIDGGGDGVLGKTERKRGYGRQRG